MDTQANRTAAAVVALKAGTAVKSRLAVLSPALRSELAWAMSVDTLRVLADGCDRVVVVSDRPGLVERLASAQVRATVISDGQAGMNEALTRGDRWLREQGYSTVLACVGDLPALRRTALAEVLSSGSAAGRSFVADRSGIGTTMLLARGVALDPRFQGRSAQAHADSGAALLEVDAAARCDVDTVGDLGIALDLGVGPATADLIASSAELHHRLGRSS